MVIKWIAEQGNPMQSKGNLCNQSAIHCNLVLQFCFAIQIILCNLTAIQEDCSLIAEIAKVRQYTYTCPSAQQGVRHVARCFILIVEIAV